MTCIVGVAENGDVIIGGDSMGSDGYTKQVRLDQKVFRRGPFVIGFCGSFRMGQVLHYQLRVPDHPRDMDDYEYMVTLFVNAVRECLMTAGVGKKNEDNTEEGGTFLVGYKGKLYVVEGDYQVGVVGDSYDAIGSGHEIAKGAMYAQSVTVPAKRRIRRALEAASKFSMSVGPPFNFVSSEGTEEAIKVGKRKTSGKKARPVKKRR